MKADYVDMLNKKIKKELGDGPVLFLLRADGVLLYEYRNLKSKVTAESISTAVLMCGMWQAAQSLVVGLPETKESFRLSFDTANQGVYLLPVKNGKETYYLGMLYSDEVNPAYLKQKMKSIVPNVQNYISDCGAVFSAPKEKAISKNSHTPKRNGFLFEDISDDEMDALFKFAGS